MRKALTILVAIFLIACANEVPPSGGPNDEIPPQLRKSSPPMESTNFNGDEFELEFDELIELKSVNTQLVVSPPMKEKPHVKYLKKKVHVHFKGEVLQDSTTYTFNFGNAIVDYNAGNVTKNFTYVFSTGDYIDSLSIEGNVIDAFSKEAIENMVVMLYKSDEDSLPLTSLPNYFGMTSESGNYKINNIKEGRYKVFALEDMNQNYLYDRPEERIAFLDEMLVLDSNLTDIDLLAFVEESDKQFILRKEKTKYGKLRYVFNKAIEKLEIKLEGQVFDVDEYQSKLSESKDTLDIWFPDYEGSFSLILKADSLINDTNEVKVTALYNLDKQPEFNISSNITGTMELNNELLLSFDNPIKSWNPNLIDLFEDSLEIDLQPVFTDSSKLLLKIPHEWKEKAKYNLRIGIGAFTDFYNLSNEFYELKFGARELSYYGNINVEVDISTLKTPFIFQMMDSEGRILSENTLNQNQTLNYSYLRPVEYSFRIIQDLNSNGKWDAGDYADKRQAEPIIYYPETTKVRSNWEIDLSWELKKEALIEQ